jgi:hypothetical protein
MTTPYGGPISYGNPYPLFHSGLGRGLRRGGRPPGTGRGGRESRGRGRGGREAGDGKARYWEAGDENVRKTYHSAKEPSS